MSHVHVDVALELGAIGDCDPRCFDIAYDARTILQVDAIIGGDVACDIAGDRNRTACDIGLDGSTVIDGHCIFRDEFPAKGALHEDIFFACHFALDCDSDANDRARHNAVPLTYPVT